MRIKKAISAVVSVLAVVGLAACSSVSEAALDKAASEERLALASMFSRELRSLAAQTPSATQAASSPQDPAILLSIVEVGDVRPGVTITTNGAASGPVMVFDGASLIASREQLASVITLIEFGINDAPVCLVVPEQANEEPVISDGPCLF